MCFYCFNKGDRVFLKIDVDILFFEREERGVKEEGRDENMNGIKRGRGGKKEGWNRGREGGGVGGDWKEKIREGLK